MHENDKRLRGALCALAASLATLASAGPFTPGNLVLYRAGTGSGALVATGNPVFLDEYTPAGAFVQSIAMPTLGSGANKALLASGTATSDGLLTRSADGTCLAVPGYGRDLGLGGGNLTSGTVGTGTGAPPIPRVVARVAANAGIDTSTSLPDAAVGTNFRGAATADCTGFWVSGNAGGVRYAALGASGSADLTGGLTPALVTTRAVAIFGGQLYASSSATALTGVGAIGTGLPTSGTQPISKLPGSTTPSTYSFFLADLDAGVAGYDTLYVADDGAGALSKFALVAGTWVARGTIGTASDTYRGLTAVVSGASVTLYATRKGGSGSTGGGELVTLVDASGYNGVLAGTPTVLVTAANQTAIRGVALAPAFTITPSAGMNGTIDPSLPVAVAAGGTKNFTVTPDAGYTAVVGGTCGGTLAGNTFTTDPATASCTVAATFTQIPTYVVTPLAGANGSINPSTPRTLLAGATTSFVVTPAPGYAASVASDCGGAFDGVTYMTAPASADCTVTATFTLVTFNVVSSAGANGAISPSGTLPVPSATTASFTVTPDHGFGATVGGTCGGTLAGTTFTTAPVTADCTVVASFPPLPRYGVNATAGAHGSISPASPQAVISGDTTSITIVPDAGYNYAVRGTCGGSLSGNVFTTRAVGRDCTIAVAFARKLVLFVGNSYTFGRVDPVMSYNTANVTDLTWDMWLDNPDGTNDDEPHPWGGIPGVFKKLTDQAGLEYDVSISARNAASLRGHFLNSNPAGWDLRGNVASQRFDTVVLQDLSDEPLPPGRGANASLPLFDAYVDKFEAYIHQGVIPDYTETQLFGGTAQACHDSSTLSANQCDTPRSIPPNPNARAQAQVFLYETWARPDMIGPNGTNANGQFYTSAEGLEAMTADFHAAYFGRAAANGNIEDVAPVGDAFLRAVQTGVAMRDPYVPVAGKVNLWHTDFFHPSKYGSYLSALVHFATITGIDPTTFGPGEQAAADLGIAPDIAVKLQVVARDTVMPDVTPPQTTASAAPPPNARGWNRTPVTITFAASDNPGGNGVGAISYALAGAQASSGSVAPGGSITISAQGTTTLTYFATDAAGNAEAPHALVIRIDSTAPAVAVPASFAVDATAPSGALVTYAASASDNLDASPSLSCTPASGATFAIGTRSVACVASDAAGNPASASFNVSVRGAAEQAARLVSALLNLRGVNVSPAVTNLLASSLQVLLNNTNGTLFCTGLTIFAKQMALASGHGIPAAQAAQFVADANRIRAVQGCR
jgi:HYR domain-containing protein